MEARVTGSKKFRKRQWRGGWAVGNEHGRRTSQDRQRQWRGEEAENTVNTENMAEATYRKLKPWQTWKGTAVARMNPGVTILFLDMAASYGLGGQSRVNNDLLRQPPHPSRLSWTSIACKGAAGHLSANSSSAHQREQL
nr:hypothetical protein Itr_chr11CG16340 [Ipomoea trifida]